MTDAGSSVPRRQLGRHLRQLRERARMTVKAAGEALDFSMQKIWRIETGRGHERIRTVDVEAMCRLYGASDELTAALVALAKETKARGWWQSYGDVVPEWFELYVSLEAASCRMRHYEPELVPGLLQTRGYAGAVFGCRPELSAEERGSAVAVRMARQALLVRPFPEPPRYEVVLAETVLRRPIADRAAMADQLRALLAAGRSPLIDIRILPLAAGPTRASEAGGFVILDFPAAPGGGPGEPTTVYSEGLTGALYLDRPAEVAAYEAVWSALTQRCLSAEQSRKRIAATIGEMSSCPR